MSLIHQSFFAIITDWKDSVLDAAFDMFSKFSRGDKKAIDPNLRSSVYRIVLRHGAATEVGTFPRSDMSWGYIADSLKYDVILNEFRTAEDGEERNIALSSLGTAEDKELINRTLQLALSDEVKSQDIHRPLASLRSHASGVEALWQWLQDNWSHIEAKLDPAGFMLSSVVQICTSSFTRSERIDEIQRFFKDRKTAGFDQALAQALDSIKAKVSWLERDREDVKEWLKANGYL